jgi:hypothetical protein
VAPAQDMEVKMKHTLATIDTGIDDEAIPGIGNPLLFCDRISSQQQTPEQHDVRILELGNRGEMFSRDDERMDRRLRVDIVERHHQLVFIDERCWNSPRNDFTKKTVAHLVASFLKPDFPKRVANS